MGVFHIERDKLSIIDAITGATATAESDPIDIAGAKGVSLMLTRADHAAGSTTWKVQISMDGTVWEDYNMLISNVTNTNAQNYTRVASLVQSANGTELVMVDVAHLAARYMKLIATEDTDGTHTGVVAVER